MPLFAKILLIGFRIVITTNSPLLMATIDAETRRPFPVWVLQLDSPETVVLIKVTQP